MIAFKFLETVDADYQDFDFKNHYDELLIGRSRRCHVVLEDKDLAPIHFRLFVDEENLLIETRSEEKMHINGKKFKGTKKLTPGDKVKFGENEIQIIEYKKLSFPSIDLEKLYEDAINKSPELENIISLLERELLYLESKQNVQE